MGDYNRVNPFISFTRTPGHRRCVRSRRRSRIISNSTSRLFYLI
jgi:hypothetical protein